MRTLSVTFQVLFITFIIAALILVVTGKVIRTSEDPLSFDVSDDYIVFSNVTFKQNLEDDDGYGVIEARDATYNTVSGRMIMEGIDATYVFGGDFGRIQAEHGDILRGSNAIFKGGLKGSFGEISFKGFEDSVLYYDFFQKKGIMENGVYATDGVNDIVADNLYLDEDEDLVEFYGNLVVNYADYK